LAGAAAYSYVWIDKAYSDGVWAALSALAGFLAMMLGGALQPGLKMRHVLGSFGVGALGLNFVRILIDTTADPTAHNLFPFELAYTFVVTGAGGLAGIALGRLGLRVSGKTN
jgi:hypothetical protein